MPMQSGVVSAVRGPQGLPLLAESVRQPREPTSAVGFAAGMAAASVPKRQLTKTPSNKSNGSPQTVPVFFFFGEGCGDPLLVLPSVPGVGLLPVLVCGGQR